MTHTASNTTTTKNKINVLLIGSGGREHAIAEALAISPMLGTLHITDQTNPALQQLGTPIDVPVSRQEIYRLEQYCNHHNITLVVIGPEDPLAEGFTDALATETRFVFGPTQAGARLESDKAWAKQFMRQMSIPTAEGRSFTDADGAHEFVRTRLDAMVVKASGLAKGKGVIVPATTDEAHAAVDTILVNKQFGDAGNTVIVEEQLKGPEVSVFALTDGKAISVLDVCQDHKRLLDNDKGPNTGGMGAFCPSPLVDDRLLSQIERDILVPTISGLRREGIVYRGVLYVGLMLTHAGPRVLEYNVRFGDPEAQVLLPRFASDVLEMMLLTAQGKLDHAKIRVKPGAACSVVLASENYPDSPRTGVPINGLDTCENTSNEHVRIYHAGTKRNAHGDIVTSGGRVLAVTGLGDDLQSARDRAYEAAKKIHFAGMQMRTDIGASVLTKNGVGQ